MDVLEPHRYIHPVRAGSMVQTYVDIAEQAFGDFLNEAATGGLGRYEGPRVSGIKTIVFAAMAIEAAAFEFAATALGDLEASKPSLDRVSLVPKWKKLTRQICGQSLDNKGLAIQHLAKLVQARNKLVHYKSVPENVTGTVRETMRTEWVQFEEDQVPNAYMTLVLLSLELEASPCGIFGGFLWRDRSICPPGFRNDYLLNARVKKVIDRCQEIHKKHLKGV
ncbi:hypothetical protein [Pseudomonas lactucae]|uniref:hypothetical protein n=1 Tax=Pseudomonas lactucae TaxID=2813360 RepID=UPI0031344B40